MQQLRALLTFSEDKSVACRTHSRHSQAHTRTQTHKLKQETKTEKETIAFPYINTSLHKGKKSQFQKHKKHKINKESLDHKENLTNWKV